MSYTPVSQLKPEFNPAKSSTTARRRRAGSNGFFPDLLYPPAKEFNPADERANQSGYRTNTPADEHEYREQNRRSSECQGAGNSLRHVECLLLGLLPRDGDR